MANSTAIDALTLPLEECSVETHACQCTCEDSCEEESATTINIYTWQLNCLRLERRTAEFQAKTGIKVNIECIGAPLSRDEFHADILSQAKTQTALFDGFTLGPHLYGDLDLQNGLVDFTDLIRDREIGRTAGYDLKWNDIFRFARENGASYDSKIVGLPIDGDVHSLYYRTDLFEKYNKTPPATWEEYSELAKFFHGRMEPLPGGNSTDLVQISGSCVGKLERTEFWVFLVMSSMTQYAGTQSGAFFDPRRGKGMEPLLGEAFVKTLQYMEEQFIYGSDNEFEGSFKDANLDRMNHGRCAMTYNWGDGFTEANKAPPTSYIAGYLGTAPTPGSRHYLNRDTQKLEPCTDDICSCGNEMYQGHEKDTCINAAPYAAFTGWSGSCNNFTSPSRKKACAEFFGYISSPETSVVDTIPNVTVGAPFIIVDPFRISQTQLSDWTDRGLPEESTREYLKTIKAQLDFHNVVLDMRIPGSAEFQSTMNDVFRDHFQVLQKKKDAGKVGEEVLSTDAERWAAERDIRNRWRAVIEEYDRTHYPPLLEAYQRNLGVYSPAEIAKSQIGVGPVVGIVAAILAVIVVAFLAVMREKNRKNDEIWKIQKSEIKFESPALVVGRGRWGVVVLGEYRGTDVAVKRLIPPKSKHSGTASSESFDKFSHDDVETARSPGATSSTSRAPKISGTTSSNEPFGRSSEASGKKMKTRRELHSDFKKEMRLLSRLRHPCITNFIGAVISPREEPMLVMEYMHHGSLYDILHNETMALEGEMLLQLLCDITQGVRFLHANKPPVIHCDLKASNILVDARFRAKVADFGLSIKEQTGAIGTPFWMAPELLKGRKNTAATDVYAFGIILYEVFSRRDPYEGEDPVEVLKMVCDENINKRPPVPKDCPPLMESVMHDCLVADPEARPSFEELDKRLKRIDVKSVEKAATPGMNTTISLFDIFPKKIADALRQGKKVEAQLLLLPPSTQIFFSDIVGFTDFAGSLPPQKVADVLGRLYTKLDDLTKKHDIFKVETIGDAYMSVSNLIKDQKEDHVKRIAEFAAEAIAAANSTLIDEDDPEKGCVNLRIGFHSGPVVADVVGSLNPRYCLFGDTVNTSSRMESNSAPNRIHCSEASANLLRVQMPQVTLECRGSIKVKGKGTMQTFWVKHDLSTDKC